MCLRWQYEYIRWRSENIGESRKSLYAGEGVVRCTADHVNIQ